MIFVDTSALYAVMDRDDEFHERGKHQWTQLLTGQSRLLTSNYVLVECMALIQSCLGLRPLREFCGDVTPVIDTEWITAMDHQQAIQSLLAAGRRNLSLVDCSSFVLMRRLKINRAFCFDRHFAEQGFSPLT